MKSIQTAYRGYHFRSRLEARWAVFFDRLGIKWEYEPHLKAPLLLNWVDGESGRDAFIFTPPGTKYAPWYYGYGEFKAGDDYPEWGPRYFSEDEAAVIAARSARFEFGASGVTL